MAIDTLRYRILRYKKQKKKVDEFSNLLPSDEHEIAKLAKRRWMDFKGYKDPKNRNIPRKLLFKKLVLKYLEFSIDELVETGQVFFLNKRLYIEKIKSRPRRSIAEDRKWNMHEYVVFHITEDGERIEYKLGAAHTEKLYDKVKNNWNYYDQISILNRYS